jgi:PLP dependent protein
MNELGKIGKNYRRVLENIEKTAKDSGRDPADVKLVVVTKGHAQDAVETVINAGAKFLGENYVEEALDKILSISGKVGVEWHMIGHIQSRKASPVCEHFAWVHSLDSLKLARRLNRFAEEFERKLPVLLECNVSGEQSKYGWSAWDETNWSELLVEFEQIVNLSMLEVRGLMTMAPFLEDPQAARPYFRKLRLLQNYLTSRIPHANWDQLSMGMSADYIGAIQEGSTLVRIGTAIMGPRTDSD